MIHTALGVILSELQEIIEVKGWLGPRPLERLHIIAEPPLVSKLKSVRAADMRQNISPVIVVLDEVSLREAHTESLTAFCIHSSDGDRGNRVVLRSATKNAFHPIRGKDDLVHGCGGEAVVPIQLERTLPVIVER